MPETQQYIPATDGNSLVLTIDSDIQNYLEKHLETALADNPEARDGVSGIVMNVKTGEVLAMANLPDFDPNDAYKLTSEKYINELKKNVAKILKEENVKVEIPDAWYTEGGLDNLPEAIHDNSDLVDALGSARVNILMKTWRNPVIADNYEPGSTFKLMTVSTAYDLGATHAEDTYYCGGSLQVENWEIKCANTSGHGMQTLTEALMNSCNVAMMQIAQSVGMERFYDFLQGVRPDRKDRHRPARRGQGPVPPDRCGQRLERGRTGDGIVRPALHGNADPDDQHGLRHRGRRQAEKAVCRQGSLERRRLGQVHQRNRNRPSGRFRGHIRIYARGDGAGRSQRHRQECLCFGLPHRRQDRNVRDPARVRQRRQGARYRGPLHGLLHRRSADGRPADRGSGRNQRPAGIRNACRRYDRRPVVGRIMEDVLPYIGITPVYDDSESDRRELTVPSVSGKTRDDAISTLSDAGFDCIIKGDGDTVTDQVPNAGMRIAASGKVIVYMGEEKPTEAVEVPDLSGMLPDECRDTLEEYGLYLKQKGVSSAQITGDTTATKQSPEAGTKVSLGAVVTVEFSDTTTVNDR